MKYFLSILSAILCFYISYREELEIIWCVGIGILGLIGGVVAYVIIESIMSGVFKNKSISTLFSILVYIIVLIGIIYWQFAGATDYSGNNSTDSDTVSFTNDYGTPTTYCNHSGCSRYIASSGNTNCCTLHSNRCEECYCYIDEDAVYCMDCLKDYFD